MTLISEVTLSGVSLDGLEFTHGEFLNEYERLLGTPTRSEMPGPPPPYGHRNNVIHFYDDLGILLREHHATRLIEGIDFLLDPSTSYFPTSSPYSGELWVCGVAVHGGMEFGEFARQCDVPFRPHLGHARYVDGERISIQFEVRRSKVKGRPRAELISQLAVGFRDAHLMQRS